MQTVTRLPELRAAIADWRRAGFSIAFVPTMGNLHDGHLRLVDAARKAADKVVVSIFVNPTQFGPNEDFSSYPRTEAQDRAKLETVGTDLLYLPSIDDIYPQAAQTRISVAALSSQHCGASRPGHFDGVALVVCKLLNRVQPDWLLLGEKDFQQLAVIRQMVADLDLPIQIQGVATVREADGLAMSSRNGYLNPQERQLAPMLFQVLTATREAILSGNSDFQQLAAEQAQQLAAGGFVVDYFNICRSDDLQSATTNDRALVILAAARLGRTRLIDNLQFQRP